MKFNERQAISMSSDKARMPEKHEKAPSVSEQEKPNISDYKSEQNIEVGRQRIEFTAENAKNPEDQSQPKCDECDESFETMAELTQHSRQAHPES
jgi:hypothetical protein